MKDYTCIITYSPKSKLVLENAWFRCLVVNEQKVMGNFLGVRVVELFENLNQEIKASML